jgi:hypothetical protein
VHDAHSRLWGKRDYPENLWLYHRDNRDHPRESEAAPSKKECVVKAEAKTLADDAYLQAADPNLGPRLHTLHLTLNSMMR